MAKIRAYVDQEKNCVLINGINRKEPVDVEVGLEGATIPSWYYSVSPPEGEEIWTQTYYNRKVVYVKVWAFVDDVTPLAEWPSTRDK